MTKKLPAWSFSGLKSFLGCGLKYYHLKVAKTYSEPPTEATLYGTEFHLACEEYVRDGKPLPGRFQYFKDTLDALIAKPGEKVCEKKLALNADLQPCDFFAPDCWFRGIADLLILNHDKGTAFVVDYKTGKNAKYADIKQLDLLAGAIFVHFPKVETINSALLYVVSQEMPRKIHHRQHLPTYMGVFDDQLDRLEAAKENGVWNANPSGLCGWCPVETCEHWRPRRRG